MRYWYTYDTTPVVDAGGHVHLLATPAAQCANITRVVGGGHAREDERGLLLPDRVRRRRRQPATPARTGEFRLGFNKNDCSELHADQRLLVQRRPTAFTTTTKVTVVPLGVLVYGTEPP